MEVSVGCCGFRSSRKSYYKNFTTVEVQMTFYRIFEIEMFKKWKDEAPENFVFNIKAFQGVTHPVWFNTWRRYGERPDGDYGYLRPTPEVAVSWHKTLEVAQMFESEFILVQLPKSFKPSAENIYNAHKFFATAERRNFKIAVELRGWDPENIYNLCKEHDLIDVVDILRRPPVYLGSQEILYIRLHGAYGKNNRIFYQYSYSDEELEKVLDEIYRISPKRAMVYFNNSAMVKNALAFKKLLSR